MIDGIMDIDSAVEAPDALFSNEANRHAIIKKFHVKGFQSPWVTSDLPQAMRV